MNFAPVVDVITEEREAANNGLYSRSFGKSKENVAELAKIYLTSLQAKGCLGCLKHFPGLGASRTDSHEDLPVVDLTSEELFAVDLFPYREIFKSNQVSAVMVAHACYPLLDLQEIDSGGKLLPSSLSGEMINNLLRRKLNFQNLIISDDLEMGAILKNYTIGDACKMAIQAGVDMVSICADPENIRKGYASVVEAVRTGEISESRIDESLARIAKVKSLIQPSPSLNEERWEQISNEIAELATKVNYRYGG